VKLVPLWALPDVVSVAIVFVLGLLLSSQLFTFSVRVNAGVMGACVVAVVWALASMCARWLCRRRLSRY